MRRLTASHPDHPYIDHLVTLLHLVKNRHMHQLQGMLPDLEAKVVEQGIMEDLEAVLGEEEIGNFLNDLEK